MSRERQNLRHGGAPRAGGASDGAHLDPWRGLLRALVFPLSFLLFGLGLLGILVQREHRALHDLIVGSAVVYAWNARAARLRFLAREAEPVASAEPGQAELGGSDTFAAESGEQRQDDHHVERDDRD